MNRAKTGPAPKPPAVSSIAFLQAQQSARAAPNREFLDSQASIERQLAALDSLAEPADARLPIRDALAFGAQVLRSIA